MFTTLLLKEIQETILTSRFLITVLLCIVLIPVGTFVSLKDYNQRFNNYQESIRLYQERSENNVRPWFRAEGYRPPSKLSFLSKGLEDFLPNKIITDSNGRYRIESEAHTDISQSSLSGKIDFQFIISTVMTLLAFILTFASIVGEKESATLRLMMSNQVARWKVILAKILGNYILFLAPFFVSLLLMALTVNVIGTFNLFSVSILGRMLAIIVISLLLLLSMFSLGTLVSTLTKHSMTSIVVLLFTWVLFALVIPKLSPMIAEVLYTVKSRQVLSIEKQMAGNALFDDFKQKQIDLLDRVALDYGIEDETEILKSMRLPENGKILDHYNEEKIPLEKEYEKLITSEMSRFDKNHQNKKSTQTAIAKNLSRISPISSYAYIVSEITNTGLMEIENIERNAQIFQNKVREIVYDKAESRSYYTASGSSWNTNDWKNGIELDDIPVPIMDSYIRKSLDEILQSQWVDIAILLLYNVLFFVAAYVSFLRYDVR